MKTSVHGLLMVMVALLLFVLLGCKALPKLPDVSIKPEFTALKAQEDVNALKAQVQGDMAAFKGDVARNLEKLMENAVVGLKNDIEEMTAGRDIVTTTQTTNDAGLMWKIIYGLLGIIGTLLSLVTWIVKRLFREMASARYYQVELAAETNAEKLDAIMKKKKDIERQRTLRYKAMSALKEGVSAIKQGGGTMNKLLLVLVLAVMAFSVAVVPAGADELSPGAYFRIPGTMVEFTYPLANTSAIALYDFWKAEGLMGAETRLVTWHNLNLNFGAVTSFTANGMPFVSMDFNFGAILANTATFLARMGVWYGHDFRANDNRAGFKASVPLW